MSLETLPQAPPESEIGPQLTAEIKEEVAAKIQEHRVGLAKAKGKDGSEKMKIEGAEKMKAEVEISNLYRDAVESGDIQDRLKTWYYCVAIDALVNPVEHAKKQYEPTKQQQILASVAYLYPEVDNGFYKKWLGRHREEDAKEHSEDLEKYADIWNKEEGEQN